ncbi:hypothetical protein Q8W71_25545 [Methylobacterium sp. NEAU 140]|uniref:hypothetical protein n=1 Tax=Methylobacterium sp. NEAU 140 TaxID=3064945 RepID=UPI002732A40B|nr:hypothetical protein [Methylobacterium sp. NEAU 140]MDP4026000.1 hypothetical protein [Methylobacterium sp. NEAU 140]
MTKTCDLEATLNIDIIDYAITGRLQSSDRISIVRLLLVEIGVEAGTVAHPIQAHPNDTEACYTFDFAFDGDIVRAALWLRRFDLSATTPDGRNISIAIPNNYIETLETQGSKSKIFGSIAFAGRSWLFENRVEFADEHSNTLPSPKSYPVFGVLGAAFGDSMWRDDNGCPSADGILNCIPHVYQAMMQHKKLRLLIDMSNEGQPLLEDWMTLLHNALDQRGIPSGQCVLLQQNRMFFQQYRDWILKQQFEPMRIFAYDYYPRRMIGYMENMEPLLAVKAGLRSKFYTCLNFTPRPNRTSVVSWLMVNDYITKGYVSFGSFDLRKKGQHSPELCSWFPEIYEIQKGLQILLPHLPLVIDLDPASQAPPEFELGPPYIYADSYFSIVTETEVSGGDMVRITEKVIKPLAMYHPIIIIGNPYSLQLLKGLGFKTFDGFFDETYDLILDPSARVKYIMNEIRRKLAMTKEDLHCAYWQLWPTLAYNASHARRVLGARYRYQIEPDIIEQISANDVNHILGG